LDHPLYEGISVLQASRFYPFPSSHDNFKAVGGLDIWKFCLALFLQHLFFISMNKLATFGYVMGVLSHGNLSLFSENFTLASQRK
jgi:hypothetical protein